MASLEPLFNAVECHKKGERKKKEAPKTTKEMNSKKFCRPKQESKFLKRQSPREGIHSCTWLS